MKFTAASAGAILTYCAVLANATPQAIQWSDVEASVGLAQAQADASQTASIANVQKRDEHHSHSHDLTHPTHSHDAVWSSKHSTWPAHQSSMISAHHHSTLHKDEHNAEHHVHTHSAHHKHPSSTIASVTAATTAAGHAKRKVPALKHLTHHELPSIYFAGRAAAISRHHEANFHPAAVVVEHSVKRSEPANANANHESSPHLIHDAPPFPAVTSAPTHTPFHWDTAFHTHTGALTGDYIDGGKAYWAAHHTSGVPHFGKRAPEPTPEPKVKADKPLKGGPAALKKYLEAHEKHPEQLAPRFRQYMTDHGFTTVEQLLKQWAPQFSKDVAKAGGHPKREAEAEPVGVEHEQGHGHEHGSHGGSHHGGHGHGHAHAHGHGHGKEPGMAKRMAVGEGELEFSKAGHGHDIGSAGMGGAGAGAGSKTESHREHKTHHSSIGKASASAIINANPMDMGFEGKPGH